MARLPPTHLLPQPFRHCIRRRIRVIAGGAQISFAHGRDVDLAEQRLHRGPQPFVAGALWGQQQDRIVGRDRVPGIVERNEIVFCDQPVAGVAGDDIDLAAGDGRIHEVRLHLALGAEREAIGLLQRRPFGSRENS